MSWCFFGVLNRLVVWIRVGLNEIFVLESVC